MTGRLLARGEKPHRCEVPGWRERRRLGVEDGAIWACDECGNQYRWAYDGWECTSSWTRHYPKPLTLPGGHALGNRPDAWADSGA